MQFTKTAHLCYRAVGTRVILAVVTVLTLAVSRPAASQPTQSNGISLYPPISYDGRYVAFYSLGSNLVPSDTNGTGDIFLHDRETRTTTLISVSSTGEQGNDESIWPSISGDGRFVAFTSKATNLVQRDTNNADDIFVHDLETGITTRVSVDSQGQQSNGNSYTYFPSISSDGRYVAFLSLANNLVSNDTNDTYDVFVHDRETRITTRVSVDTQGRQGNGPSIHGVISGDGRIIAFHSFAHNLISDDTNNAEDVFVHDREGRMTSRISVSSQGVQGDSASSRAAISHDGRMVAFSSKATNLVSEDTNDAEDVFAYDRQTGITTRVSVSSTGEQMSKINWCCVLSLACCILDRKSVISADGVNVVFRTDADNLVPNDTNRNEDIFVHNLRNRTTTRVSVDSQGRDSNGTSEHHAISFDGRFVSFSSEADNLVNGDTNGVSDIFVHDRDTGITTRISVSSLPTVVHDPGSTALPIEYALVQNHPNPFNPTTQIGYKLPVPSTVEILIYNVRGQKVRTLIKDRHPAGIFTIRWNGIDDSGAQVTAGVYLYQINAKGVESKPFVETRKMLFLK